MSNLAEKMKGMTDQEKIAFMTAENEAMRAQIAKKEAEDRRAMKLKIGQSGGLSVYGMGRFPVTLYQEQWARLLDDKTVADIKAFIVAHASELKSKV